MDEDQLEFWAQVRALARRAAKGNISVRARRDALDLEAEIDRRLSEQAMAIAAEDGE